MGKRNTEDTAKRLGNSTQALWFGQRYGLDIIGAIDYWYKTQAAPNTSDNNNNNNNNNQVFVGNVHLRRRPYLIVGDRPENLSLMRAWESTPMWFRVLLGVGLMLSPVLYCVAWMDTDFIPMVERK
jgi:hypothetical protein